ncbi:MAG TPA: family 10 glycosylhydrolase, partial [archaeon]|nr:family 10 glycosylhydrolase [archaeon]
MKRYFYRLLLCFSVFPLGLIPLVSGCSTQKSAGQNSAYNFVAEGRGTWIGRAKGANWDSTMAALKDAGYNMVFPNMCTGGAALYPSEFLPMISERDELALCIEAAHKYGIEVHVWRINWYMSACPDSFTQAMEKAGRIQYAYNGKRGYELEWELNRDWLCPSNPDNRKLEFDTMLELVKKYDVDGVHFDYMRFGREELCYCQGCRENFEKETGLKISKWPDDVWKDGKYREVYLDWRRQLIGSSAREIARAVHTYDPYVCVSLAARPWTEHAYNSDGQVWWEWANEGILDFICPMNYTTEQDRFVSIMKEGLPLLKGVIP